MADIFISYSKADRELAAPIAAFLESEGYSVWWDAGLLPGDKFRKTIMLELGRASAAIVIWTKNSIDSDWVLSEAGRAHAERKLIPIKARDVRLTDIPPPFDNMHIEDVTRRDKLIAAVIATLARAGTRPSLISRTLKKIRAGFLSWLAIFGTAISLLTKLGGLLTLTTLFQSILSSWQVILAAFWTRLFFFLPRIEHSDAVYFTVVSFVVLNVVLAIEKQKPIIHYRDIFSLSAASLILFSIFVTAFYSAIGHDVVFSIFECFNGRCEGKGPLPPGPIQFLSKWLQSLIGQDVFIVALGAVLLVPLLTVAISVPLVVSRMTRRHVNISTLAYRLWRVLLALLLIVILNYIFVWFEREKSPELSRSEINTGFRSAPI
jgi:hypothetical protein